MYYSDKLAGVPPVLRKHMAAFPVLHAVNFFVTNRSAQNQSLSQLLCMKVGHS